MDTRSEIFSRMSDAYTNKENRIFNDALNFHLGLTQDLSAAALICMKDRISVEIWPKDHKKLYLDNRLICEIYPLTIEMHENTLTTNFKYRIYPK